MTGPVAWIRFCGDGCVEGPILDSVIEEVQRKSGAWTPLYAAPQPAPAIDLSSIDPEWIKYAALMLRQDSDATNERCAVELDHLLALIDGQSLQASLVAQRKLRELQDDGFIVNGVAIFNPTTGRRGLVDYLGYVGWQASEQPTKGEGE